MLAKHKAISQVTVIDKEKEGQKKEERERLIPGDQQRY